ncbi:protein SGT1 homolog [Argonauta hians]
MEECDALFSQANDEFVNENYQCSIDLFTKAIGANKNKSEYFTNRAHAYFKLKQFEKAIGDAESAINLNPNSVKAYIRKGLSLFELKKYQEALTTFTQAKTIDNNNETVESWLKSCRKKLGLPKEEVENKTVVNSDSPKMDWSGVKSTTTDDDASVAAAATTTAPPETKYDWYQNKNFTIIAILEKNVSKDDIKVEFGDQTLQLFAKLANGKDYKMELTLANSIVPSECVMNVTPSKIEVKLKKKRDIHWANLEESQKLTPIDRLNNWDKYLKKWTEDEKNEKAEGDAALNHLFQQIYADGNDDVKRAMVKSYVESSGTVLSTNWTEVGEKAVDVKPPSGMEHKYWES